MDAPTTDAAQATAGLDGDETEIKVGRPVRGLAATLMEVRLFIESLAQRVVGGADEADLDAEKASKKHKLKGILRDKDGGGRRNNAHVKFRTVLAGDEAAVDDVRIKQQQEVEERERRQRVLNIMKLVRLPTLTAEELMIPFRLAFPNLIVYSSLAITIDVIGDSFEIAWIAKTVREQPSTEELIKMEEADAQHHDEHREKAQVYTAAHVVRDVCTSLSLHMARVIFIYAHDDTLWTLVQVVRCMRVRELITYVQQINNDLTTNVKFLAVYKFSLVLISIPHWFQLLTTNPDFALKTSSDFQHYIMSLYMAWAGLTSMGYGTLVITTQQEVVFAAIVATMQMVFYAFVLGTLFHYLVRTDENTVHFNELMKAVDEYVTRRKLPVDLGHKIRAHYTFQHRKKAAGTERISAQMPLSMRTEVAVAQHSRQMQSTWVFWNCTPQFLSYVALYLRERHMMPNETLFKRGDGWAELLWCVGGSLHVSKGDVHITTVRSDLGPGQIVGEVAFFIGIQQPYTVVASSKGEVTLIVLNASAFEDIIQSYPEQTDHITQNLLRKYGLDKNGADLVAGGFVEQMDEDELKEYEELRETIRSAIVERNDDLFSQMSNAVHSGDVEKVRSLTVRGFDLSTGSYDNRTPLHLAAKLGHTTVVRLLCELNADVNLVDRFSATPIRNAIDGGHGTVADELARNGARLQLDRPASHMHTAAKAGDMQTMTMLVAHDIDINCSNYDGRTALHVAASEGNARVAEYLISNMADVHKRDRWGNSPLDDAIAKDHPLVAQMLVRHSARPDNRAMGDLVRQHAAEGDVDRIHFLIEMGADVDSRDYDERSALHYSVKAGSLSSTHLLVAALADVHVVDRWLRPPLLDALELSPELAAVLAQQCGAALPTDQAENTTVVDKYDAARKVDMYLVVREITRWQKMRKAALELNATKSREMEVTLGQLAEEMSALTRSQRALFRHISRCADVWIAEYGDDDLDSDDASDDDEQDLTGMDDNSSEGSGDDADDASDANSTSQENGDKIRHKTKRRGSGSHGSSDQASASTREKVSQQFIRLVLQLPKAEAGITALRKLFETRMSPDVHGALPREARRLQEHNALLHMLEEDFNLGLPIAKEIVTEIYDELRTFLGESAPQAPDPGDHKPELTSKTGTEQEEGHRQLRPQLAGLGAGAAAISDDRPVESIEADEMEGLVPGAATQQRTAGSATIVAASPGPKAQESSSQAADSGIKTVIRRGSRSGATLVELSKHLHEEEASRRLSVGNRGDPSKRRSGGSHAPLRRSSSAHFNVFLSDLGHVVLFCSSTFINTLVNRHEEKANQDSRASFAGGFDQESPPPEGERATRPSRSVGARLRNSMRVQEPAAQKTDQHSPPTRLSVDEEHSLTRSTSNVGHSGEMWRSNEEVRLDQMQRATYVIISLFRVFDPKNSGKVELRNVKRLQGELGELGTTEIRSLVSYLMSASRAFAKPEVSSLVDGDNSLDVVPRVDETLNTSMQDRNGRPTGASAGPQRLGLNVLDVPPVVKGVETPDATPRVKKSPKSGRKMSYAKPGLLVLGQDGLPDAESLIGKRSKRRSLSHSVDGIDPELRYLPSQVQEAVEDPPGQEVSRSGVMLSIDPDNLEAAPAEDGTDGSTLGTMLKEEPVTAPRRDEEDKDLARQRGRSGSSVEHQETLAAIAAAQQAAEDARLARPRHARAMSEVQFFVGVSSWIMLSVAEDKDKDDESIRMQWAARPVSQIPKLQGIGSVSTMDSTPKARQSKAEAIAAAKAEASAAAQKAALDQQVVRDTDTALDSTAAYTLICDNIQLRFDTGRLGQDERVDVNVLVKVISHAIVVPPKLTAELLERWFERRFGKHLSSPSTVPLIVEGMDSKRDDEASSPGEDNDEASEHKGTKGARELAAEEQEVEEVITWSKLVSIFRDRAALLKESKGEDEVDAHQGRWGAILAAIGLAKATRNVHTEDAARSDDDGDGGASTRPWYIMSVYSPWHKYLYTAFLILTTWDALVVPMQLAFVSETVHMKWLKGLNVAADVLYLFRVALIFNTSFVNEKSVEVFNAKEIRKHYLDTDFALDVFACWPHDQMAWVLGASLLIQFGLRLLRLVNVRYVMAALRQWRQQLSDSAFVGGLLKNLLPLFITMHYTACIWNVMGFTEFGHQLSDSKISWSDVYLLQRESVGGREPVYLSYEEKLVDQYLVSVFFVLSLISALGVAQLPANYWEFVAFVFLALLNMTIYAWCVGGISGLVMKQDDEIVGKRAQLELVHSYVRHIHVPGELKERLTKFFQQRLQHTSLSSVDSEQIYSGLPVPLQMEVAAHTNRQLVGTCSLLSGCSNGFLDRLSSALRERELDAEAVVFRSGEACKELLIIASGAIETSEENEMGAGDENMEQLGTGDTLGEVPFVFGIRHFKTARVSRNRKATAFALALEPYRELLKQFPAQEDVIMDNAMRQYEGMATARSGRSKLSSGNGSEHSSVSHAARSDARTDMSGQQNIRRLHKILVEAKHKREELQHARLCTACAKGDYDKVRRFLSARSVDVDYGDFDGRRALHLAACGGDTRVIDLLIVARAEVNVEDKRGDTPLTAALMSDQADAAALIAKHGGRHGSRDVSDLVCSASGEANGINDLRRLCQYGGNVNVHSHEDRTPLHIAVAEGRVENAELLIANNADCNAADGRGATALQEALLAHQDATCELLVRNGGHLGNFNAARHLNQAAADNNVIHLERMIKFRCSILSQDELGRSPVHLAASSRRINALNFLLDTEGVDVNIEDNYGNTAYDDAKRGEYPERAVLLALLESHGGHEGGHHRRDNLAKPMEVEKKRTTQVRQQAADREHTIAQAHAVATWVREEKEAITAFRTQVDAALALEREKGAVLADEMPDLWDNIYAYAEGFFEWRDEAVSTAQPIIDQWSKSTKDIALLPMIKLKQKFDELQSMIQTESKPIERLYEVTFRKPVVADGR